MDERLMSMLSGMSKEQLVDYFLADMELNQKTSKPKSPAERNGIVEHAKAGAVKAIKDDNGKVKAIAISGDYADQALEGKGYDELINAYLRQQLSR